MIPVIQNRMDMANNGMERGGGENDDHLHLHNIPSSVVAELGELRRMRHTKRTRKKLNHELSKIEIAKTKAEFIEGQPMVDPRRPYGLPEGEAYQDIWDLILDHINELADVARIRDTCVLFRRILEQKYIIFRLNEIVTKFPFKVGHMDTVLSFRRVSKLSKITVDQFFLQDVILHFTWFQEIWSNYDWMFTLVPKPDVLFCTKRNSLNRGPITGRAVGRHTVPDGVHHLLLNKVRIMERMEDFNTPALESLHRHIERLLEIGGNQVKAFYYISCDDGVGTYNRLRNWIAMMPNLMALEVFPGVARGDPSDQDPPAIEILPFPSCPKLKSFSHLGFSSSIIAAIFHANPNISEVFRTVMQPFEDGNQWEVEEFNAVLRCMDTLRMERFVLQGFRGMPLPLFLEFRFGWPLKYLTLTIHGEDQQNRAIQSRTLFEFVNSFQETLQELTVTWKIHNTGGYLNVPHVSKLLWKFWPDFMSFEFIIALAKLEYLDVDVLACPEINAVEIAKQFIHGENLPHLFPAMKRIRARVESRTKWHDVWKP